MNSEMSAASAMLEDALHQFDHIIGAGHSDGNGGFFSNGLQGIAQLLDDLRVTIQAEDLNPTEKDRLLSLLPIETLDFFCELFNAPSKNFRNDLKKQKEFEKLQNENESLSLQVNVLTDQVELQMEKMDELTDANKELKRKQISTEKSLQNEIRANNENQKEIATLQEQNHSQKITLLNIESAQSPAKTRLLQQDVTTPDEGIVRDEIDGNWKTKYRIIEPMATSTPISANEPQNDRFQSGSPLKRSAPSAKETQRNSLKDTLRTSSLEKLYSLRTAHDPKKSVSQSEHLDKAGASNVIMHKQKSDIQASSSSPNLAISSNENEITPRKGILINKSLSPEIEEELPFQNRRKHGIKKFFSSFRLRRSHSSNLSEHSVTSQWGGKTIKNSSVKATTDVSPFQRGGFRATAGPRLGTSKPRVFEASTKPFAQWTTQEICGWFESLGLELYIGNCKRWLENGGTLLKATNHDIEKDLGISNPLHKKKLLLSLQAIGDEDEVEGQVIKGAGMDHCSVARWLDDIGLPQYKDVFYRARIDCRMLHHLTISDLHRMKVTNLLHTLSLRRAIHTLRTMNFDPMQLKRRPVDQAFEIEQVHLWTNHRVMEWLRSIDLAEFAPNLRGSGVHGSLLVLEPLFTGEVLSSLLHIPSSKSLLRRHLVSKFNEIIPIEFLNLKKKEAPLGGLSITAKVKIGRRSLGPLARLRNLGSSSNREFSSGEYVCPIETKNSDSHHSLGAHRRKLQLQQSKKQTRFEAEDDIILDSASDDSNNVKVVELNESVTKKIGVLSAEMATLTNKWSEE